MEMRPALIGRDMRYWLMKPDHRLQGRVHCYYLAQPISSSCTHAAAAYKDEELLMPDGHSEIVFNLGGAYERWDASRTSVRSIMRRSYLIGGRSHSVVTRDLEPVSVAGLKLDPRFLHSLIKTPLNEFSDTTLSLSDLSHRALLDLEDAVADAAHCASRVAAVLDRFFLRALACAPRASVRVDALLRHIQSQRGALSIMEWIREHRIDPRYVERKFGAMIGMTPKRYARVIRFKHTYHELVSGRAQMEVLHMDGYYDRSHFIKEFKQFVGAPPRVRMSSALARGTSISDVLLERELT